MGFDNVNVNVSGPIQPTSTYKTKVLKGNHSFASQVTEPNRKYVIKYDFDLGGDEVTIPANCVLEFDGGSLKNGTITLNSYNRLICGTFKSVKVVINGCFIDIKNCLFNTGENVPSIIYATGIITGSISNINNITIDNCRFIATEYKGEFSSTGLVSFTDCSDIKILNNEFIDGWNDHSHHSGTTYEGTNISRTININAHGLYNYDIVGNKANNVWTFLYISNGNCVNINYNTVTNTADTAIFERCTAGHTEDKRIVGNTLINIGKSAIKTLDTNNTTASGSDTLVANNILEEWGVCKRSGGLLIMTNLASSYSPSKTIRQKNATIIGNIMKCSQNKGLLFQLLNIDNVLFKGNVITAVSPESDETIFQACNGVFAENTININTNLIFDVYQHFILSNNIISCKTIKLRGNLQNNNTVSIIGNTFNTDPGDSSWLAIKVDNNKINSIITGNFFNIPKKYTDSMQTYNQNLIACEELEDNFISNNIAKYSDGTTVTVASQTTAFGKQRYPVYYAAIKGTSFIDSNNMPTVIVDNIKSRSQLDSVTKTLQTVNSGSTNKRPANPINGMTFWDETLNMMICFNGTKWVDKDGFTAAKHKGTTAERPLGGGAPGGVLSTSDIGFEYFDTTINKPIYFKTKTGQGVITWVDATGATV